MAGIDAAFLYMETPSMHLHVVGVLVLDPGGAPEGFPLEKLSEVLGERIHLIPPLRRRLLPAPAGIDHPLWIEDPGFDLADHVRRAPVSGPLSWSELEAFTGEVAGRPLDRSRPLWEMWLADLDDGTVALVTKLHHSMMDGGAGADLMASIFDLGPESDGVAPPAVEWVPDPLPSTPRQVAGSVTSLVARRTVSLTKVDLDTVLRIRQAFGTTVNDVVLAASGTALRNYLLARGSLPTRDLVAAVPVSAHGGNDDPGVVNKVSNMMVPLPLGPDDPGERLVAVHANTTSTKMLQSAFGPDSLQELTGFTLPPVMTAAARLYSGLGLARFHPPVLNLVISNVPGPPLDLYCAGARVTGIFPMGPVMEGSGVNITVLSEARHLNVGIMACPDLLDDVDELGRGFVAAVAELADLVDRG
jgi:hypothetical protein